MSAKLKRTLGYSPFDYQTFRNGFDFLEPVFSHKKSIEEGMDNVDCLLLLGGTDIHPSYYRQKHHRLNGAPANPSERDVFEWKAMLYCKANNIPMIGICRGAQFLCAFAGGKLIQHVGMSHQHDHQIMTKEEERVWVTSTHHQMMYPFDVPHEMLGWTHNPTNGIYQGEEGEHVAGMYKQKEPEIVFFPEIRALGIQGHPEYPSATFAFKKLCGKYISEYLFPEGD